MRRGTLALGLLAGLALAVPAAAQEAPRSLLFDRPAAPAVAPLAAPVPTSALALEAPAFGEDETLGEELLAARITGDDSTRTPKPPKPGHKVKAARVRPHRALAMLDARRARTLLRSLTVPGWGQAAMGRTTSATVFGLAEASIWGSFTAFRIQEVMRRQTTEKTAQLFAGIDLRGRDEEFRRIVGSYLSSDQYNQLVVYRDAAQQFMNPESGVLDPVAYRAYIAAHSLGGKDGWSWTSVDDLLRYRDQRKFMQRAAQNANTALAIAVVNRLVSAIHAARAAGRAPAAPRSWNLECVPAGGDDPTAFTLGVRARF